MKKLLVIIMMLGVASCVGEDEHNNVNHTKIYHANANSVTNSFYAQEIIIDYCKYLYISKSNGVVLIHKGNCDNPVHMLKSGRL